MITTAGLSELIDPSLRKIYVETGKERPLEFPIVMNTQDMEWNPITDRNFAGLGTMPTKPEATQFKMDDPIAGTTKVYTAVAYGMGFEVSWEMWRDDMFGFMQTLARELGRASRNRQEVQAWSVYNNAFNTSFTGFQATTSLCSTTHTGLDGTVSTNRPAVEVGVSVTGIQQAVENFEGMVNERNLPWLKTPSMVIIDPANKWVTREVLASSGKPFTADNEFNSLLEEDLGWMVSHYITTATNWFVQSMKGEHDLWFMWRDHPMMDSFDDERTKTAVFTSYQRHTEGFGEWRGIWGSSG